MKEVLVSVKVCVCLSMYIVSEGVYQNSKLCVLARRPPFIQEHSRNYLKKKRASSINSLIWQQTLWEKDVPE